MASGIWKYLNKDKTYKSNSDNSGQQNSSAGTTQSYGSSKSTKQTGGIWNYLDKDTKTFQGNESVYTPQKRTYSQSNRQTSTKTGTTPASSYNANKVNDLMSWSKAVRSGDTSTIGDLTKQAQDFQDYFSKNGDRYDARTMNTVSQILKNGQNMLQMNGRQAMQSQQTQGFNRLQPNSDVGSYEGQIRALEQQRDRYANEEYNMAPEQQYEKSKEIDAQIEELRRQNDELKRQDKIRGYASSMTQSDFAERSRYQSTANGKERKTAIDGKISESGYDDYMYDYINKNPDAVFVHDANTNYGQTRAGTDDAELLQMNEQEIAVFNYLYSRNRNEAYDFVETIRPELRQRQAQAETAEWSKFADENPVLSSVLSVPNNLVSSIDSLIGMGVAKASGEEIDPNAGYFRGRRANTAIRGTVGQKTGNAFSDVVADVGQQYEQGVAALKGDKEGVLQAGSQERYEELKNSNFGQIANKLGNTTYGSVMSYLDNMMNVALTGGVGGAALTLMSATAVPDTIISAKERGLSDEDAFALGVISGAAEYFTEKVSLETLFDMEKIAKDGLIRYIGANAFTEGSEEVASDFINFVAEDMIAQDKSEFNDTVRSYEAQGMSHEDAVKAAWADQVEQSLYSFVGGAIAGTGGAAGFAIGYQINQGRVEDYGSQIRQNLSKDDPLQNLSDEELGQMFVDQARIDEEDRISRVNLEQAAQQVASGEEVSPVLADAIQNDENAIRMLQEETSKREGDVISDMRGALSQYAENMAEAEARSNQFINEEGKVNIPKNEYVSRNRALSQAVSDEAISRTFGEEGAKIYQEISNRAIENGMSPQQAYQEISQIYNAGNNMRNISGINTNLPEADVNTIFKAGVQDSTRYAEGNVTRANFASAQGETGVVMNELVQSRMTNPSEAKKINAMNSVAQALGLRVNYVEHLDANGMFNQRTKEITIAADADSYATMSWVFGHEMTHRLQQVAPKEYNTLKQAVADALGGRFNLEVQRELNKALREGVSMTQQQAQDEAVANFVGELVNDRNALQEFINEQSNTDEGKNLLERIRDFFQNLIRKLSGASGQEEIVDNIQKTINALNAALTTGAENVAAYEQNLEDKATDQEAFTSEEEVIFSTREQKKIQENAVKWNEEVFTETGKRNVPKNVLTRAGLIMEAMAEILEQPDVAQLLPDESDVLSGTPTTNPFTDEKKKRTTVFGNDSYGYSVENSTICIRSLAMELLLDRCSEMMGHSLSTREAIALSQMAWSMTDQPTCQYCYVFADRMAQRQARDNYIKDRDAALKNVGKIGPKTKIVSDEDLITTVYKTNKKGETTASDDKFVLEQAIEARPKLAKQLRAYDQFLAGRKNTENQRNRFRMFLEAQKNGVPLVSREQVASEQAMINAVNENPSMKEQMADIYKYSNGASHAKAKVEYTAYNNDILKMSDEAVALMNREYGIRFYSYSDFHPAFILENMQMFTDAAVRGLKGLAYTKDLDYVRIFADTGANINVSLKMIDGTVGEMDAMQGADWEGARELRDKYPGVGTVMVCTSDEQVEWALAQDWIDMVLPYHTCFSAEVGKAFNWKDFRSFQSDAKISGMWNEKAGDLKSISPYEHKNNKKKYLELCKKNHLTPRFNQWVDNPNYMKLVIETRRAYDKTPPLQPKFNQNMIPGKEDTISPAEQSINDMKKRGGYNNPFGGSIEEMNGLAEDMVKNLNEKFSDLAEREDGWAATEEFQKDTFLLSRKEGMVREGNSAVMTNERINNRIIDDGAESNPRYAPTWIVKINPSDFLSMTLSEKLQDRDLFDTYPGDYNSTVNNYDFIEGGLKKEKRQTPYLAIDTSTGQVVGHEGRHRMRALEKAGITSAEIFIEFRSPGVTVDSLSTDYKYNEIDGELVPVESMTIYNQRETGQSAELNNIVPVNGNARSKGWLDSFGENTVQDGDIRYSRKDSDAKDSEIERIKSKKRTNAKDRQMLRDAGEKLTKADFYKLYLAHKLDLRGNGNIDEQIESIKSDGFRGDGGFGQNVVPSSINNAERYSESERRAYLKDVGLSDTDIEESINDMRQNPGRGTWIGDNYFPRLNYTEYRYGGRAGDTILLVPEHFTDHAEKVTNGFKPFDYEVVTVEYDFQPYYELYSKAYDEAKGTRYSQELDSTGRQLSVGQQEYFKDSKIRDEDGNLLVVYHGSSEDFTIFDRTKSRANMDIQGSFFSPWEIDAGGYGENVRAFYLNITNPASEAEGYKALKKFQGQNNAGVKAREYLVSLGYDGVNNGNEEYIAFYPEQIKRTDNENPTEDVDIRKSRRSGETMSSLVEAAEANYRSERVHQEFLDAAKEWRNNATALNEAGSNGFNRRMTSLINEYGDNIDKKESDKLVGEIRSLTKSIMRNPDISYQEISDSAGAIAAKIMWGKKGTTDNLLFNEEAAMAVEDIKNDMLAQILNTTTRHQKIAKDFEEYRKQTQDRIEKIRDKRDARFEKMKAEAREAKERARERKHESEDRTKLLNVMRRLDTLAKKSDELTAAKVQELIGDYDLVAKSMTRGRVAQLTRLRDFVDYMFETDPDFMPTEKTVKLIQRLDQKRISDIKTVQEVRDLTEALLNLEHEIREHKRLIDTQYNQDIAALGDQMYEDVMATKGIGNGKVGVFNWFQQGLDKAIATPTIRPETEILRLVGFNRNSPLYQLTFGTENSLASGQRDMVLYQWNANRRYFDKFLNDRAFVQEIMGSKAKEYKITGRRANGEKVTLSVTPDLLMALYMHSQNEQNFRHFGEWVDENVDGRRIMQRGGGITIPDFKQYRKGNLEEAYRIGKRDKNKITMSRADLNIAMEQLSEKERAFIQAAQRYYSEMSQTEINRVSEKLLGYSIAQVDNYFRINTDSDYRGTNMDAIKMDGTIEGMGFTKERTGARNAILLISLSEQLKRDIDAHGKYVGMAIPVRNFNKAFGRNRAFYDEQGNWNGPEGSVQEAIHGKWGKGANNYIDKLMSDIQNPVSSKDGWKGILGKLRSFYAGSVLALNFGVAMKQAASYPTAAAEIGWLPLIKAFGNTRLQGKMDMNLVNKYSPLMYLRTQGMGYQEIADLKNLSKGALNRALNSKALNWIQDIDVMTVKKLWKASEYYVRSNFKELKVGTDEYYRKVGEIHSNIIERTQPNYTTLQRGEILRSDSDIVRTVLGMFKTQPFQNFSILFESVGELRASCIACKVNPTVDNKAMRKAAVKKLSRAISSQLISSLVFALMQGAWDWLRGKDEKYKDEEGNITFGSFLKQMTINMGSNAFGMVPLGSVMYEAIEVGVDAIVENNGGEKIFDAMAYGADASTATGIINDMQDALLQIVNLSSSFGGEKKPGAETSARTLVDVGSKIMQAAGYPAGNFVKDVQTVGVNIFRGLGGTNAMNKYEAEYYTKRVLGAVSSKNKGEYIDLLIRAYDNDKEAYDKLYSLYIENDGFATEKKSSKEVIDEKIEKHVKETAKGTYWDQEEVDKEKAEKEAESAKTKAENEKKIQDAGITREQQLKLDELLIKYDSNHDGSASQGEMYDALKEINLTQKQKTAIWEASGFKKTMDEYAEVRAKEEAKQKVYDSVGLTEDELEEYKQKRTGRSQEETYNALMSIALSQREREALWDENGWKKSFSEYANSR